jgi:hypothetical protein
MQCHYVAQCPSIIRGALCKRTTMFPAPLAAATSTRGAKTPSWLLSGLSNSRDAMVICSFSCERPEILTSGEYKRTSRKFNANRCCE